MSAFNVITEELAKNAKGYVYSNANVAKLKAQIKSNAAGLAALALAEQYLNKAYVALGGYNLVDHAAGVVRANQSLIENTLAFIVRLQGRIPNNTEAPNDRDANGVAVALLQSIDCLRTTDLYARDSSAFSYTSAFLEALSEVLDAMVKKIIVPVLKATSSIWLPLAIAAGGILLITTVSKSR